MSDGAEGVSLRQQQAVALAYEAAQGPPRVVAKGRGAIAEAILARAHAHGVYVHESRELLALLMQLDLDAHIPAALYRAVAELLAWLHHLDAGLIHSDEKPPALTLPASSAAGTANAAKALPHREPHGGLPAAQPSPERTAS